MRDTILLLVLSFIVVIAVVFLTDSIVKAALIIFLVINLAAAVAFFNRQYIDITPDNQPAEAGPDDAPGPSDTLSAVDDHHIYGPFYERWHGYHTDYTNCHAMQPPNLGGCGQNARGMDTAAVELCRQRGDRDKRSIDGAVTKDANYYRYHFAEELDEEEKKPWWGRAEY